MKSDNYTLLKCDGNTYFLGSKQGEIYDISLGEQICEPCFDRIYYIKGGPGTGKSTFLKKISQCGLSHGYSVRTFLCASDVNSVDGIVISNGNTSYGFFDATSPHTMDTVYPGVISSIINTSDFRDDSMLINQREDIMSAYGIIEESNRNVQKVMERINDVSKSGTDTAVDVYDTERLLTVTAEYINRLDIERGSITKAYTHSFSSAGKICLDTFYKKAERILVYSDIYNAPLLTEQIYRYLIENSIKSVVCMSPTDRNSIKDIFIEGCNLLITSTYSYKELNDYSTKISHFYDSYLELNIPKDIKKLLKLYSALQNELETYAVKHLKNSFNYHMKLENYYKNATDFGKFNAYTDSFTETLFDM